MERRRNKRVEKKWMKKWNVESMKTMKMYFFFIFNVLRPNAGMQGDDAQVGVHCMVLHTRSLGRQTFSLF